MLSGILPWEKEPGGHFCCKSEHFLQNSRFCAVVWLNPQISEMNITELGTIIKNLLS